VVVWYVVDLASHTFGVALKRVVDRRHRELRV
jgi:hypothetical protein